VNVQWSHGSAKEVYINDQPVAPVSKELVCATSTTWRTLRVVAPNGTSEKFTVYIGVFLSTTTTKVLFVIDVLLLAFGALIAAIFWPVPLVNNRVCPLLKRLSPGFQIDWKLTLRSIVHSRDTRYITLLALVFTVPLILLRKAEWAQNATFTLAIAALCFGVLAMWLRPHYRSKGLGNEGGNNTSKKGLYRFSSSLGISLFLLICTVVTFYIPMRDQFWAGGDEPFVLQQGQEPIWSTKFDQRFGRPFVPLGAIVATHLSPNRVDGFLWLAFILRYLTGITLYSLLRLLFPEWRAFALTAAVLFVANPSEPTRFLAIYMQAYNMGVFFLVLSLGLCIHSYWRENRITLVGSCLSLGISLLIVEVGFLVSLLWPLILLLIRRKNVSVLPWLYAWFITLIILAGRFIQTQVLSGGSYQGSVLGTSINLERMFQNTLSQMAATLRYLQIPSASSGEWLYGIAVFFIVCAGMVVALRSRRLSALPLSRYTIGAIGAILAIALALLPYLPISGILGTFRTQFFAAPAQAGLWAIGIACIGSVLPVRGRISWMALSTALLVMIATVGALQLPHNRPINPNVSFQKTARIVQQVHKIVPTASPKTVFVFIPAGETNSPIGWNYHVLDLFYFMMGVEAYQANYIDTLGVGAFFGAEGIGGEPGYPFYPYNQLIVFQVNSDGEVKLLESLPGDVLPEGSTNAHLYNPVARIQAGKNNPLPFLP
jgi:hypothetical protein